tara:strand:+ start:69 stop:683 length:615 start_codon:yes stop_codon:yes gene_type:complete
MIKTFSSRAGRLSETNKKYLASQLDCILEIGQKPNTKLPKVLDIGFGDAQSFSEDVLANTKFCFIGIEPYKKGYARALEFFDLHKPNNLYLFNGDAREFLHKMSFKADFVRIHFPDPWPKKKHKKRRLISKDFLTLLHKNISSIGKIEILTDSFIYQKHIDEILRKQKLFESIRKFEISFSISSFHKKALDKRHKIKKYMLKKA